MTSRFSKPLLLAVLSAALVLPGLGRLTMSRQQELRVALTARQMAQGGSWLIPEFRDQPRLQKPPLMYWLVACSFRIVGNTMSVPAARFSSAMAGIFLVVITYLGGSILIGRRRAYIAALVAATSFMLIRHARLAETDVTLALFTALATLSGYVALRRSSMAVWLVAGTFVGLGFLTKGPAALAIPLLAIVFYAAAQPSTRKMRHVGGILLAILVCGANCRSVVRNDQDTKFRADWFGTSGNFRGTRSSRAHLLLLLRPSQNDAALGRIHSLCHPVRLSQPSHPTCRPQVRRHLVYFLLRCFEPDGQQTGSLRPSPPAAKRAPRRLVPCAYFHEESIPASLVDFPE